jgi:uncharacterized protein (TIGR04222 family)
MQDSIFDLNGPQFLMVYVAVSAGAILFVRYRLNAAELGEFTGRIDLKEPLTIAYLRGGAVEVLRVAAFSLVDRGLLLFDGHTLCAKSAIASSLVRKPLEIAMLERLVSATPTNRMLENAALRNACEEYADGLRARGLIATAETYARRRPVFLLASAILVALAAAKIVVAISSGRTNIGFLCVLAVLSLLTLFYLYHRQRTALGDRALADLRVLLEARKRQSHRIKPGGAGDDALLLSAVYGFGALSSDSFPYLKKLFPKRGSEADSNSGGSSCGSGCGGGGCGGGCGGCGS